MKRNHSEHTGSNVDTALRLFQVIRIIHITCIIQIQDWHGDPQLFFHRVVIGGFGGVIMRAQFLVDILSRLTMFTDWLM